MKIGRKRCKEEADCEQGDKRGFGNRLSNQNAKKLQSGSIDQFAVASPSEVVSSYLKPLRRESAEPKPLEKEKFIGASEGSYLIVPSTL